MNPRIESLQKMLDGPRDGALLRFSLGNEFLKAGALAEAANCFQAAVRMDPNYSAAWKALGKTLADDAQIESALAAYEQGIAVATARGDIQAAKEMGVFARRLKKTATN
jgi:tetratricopeptide (TPR) repeat protein